MPITSTLYPFAHSDRLQLRAYRPHDPTRPDLEFALWDRGEESDGELQKLDLTGREMTWRALDMQLDATLPKEELDRILPVTSDAERDVSLLVSVTCPSTKFRRVLRLHAEGPHSWSGDVSLRRRDLRSVVELRPLLARRTAIPADTASGSERTATARGSIIAHGRGVRIYLDETERPIRGALPMRWENFAESDHPWLREHKADLFFLEPHHKKPILWLNSWYPQFQRMLQGSGGSGVGAAIRHVLTGSIAQTVWLQLFVSAAGSVSADPESEREEHETEDWKSDVLDALLPRVLPEAQSEEERRRQLAEMLGSPDQLPTLMAWAGSAVQEIVGAADLFDRAVRAAESEETA